MGFLPSYTNHTDFLKTFQWLLIPMKKSLISIKVQMNWVFLSERWVRIVWNAFYNIS